MVGGNAPLQAPALQFPPNIIPMPTCLTNRANRHLSRVPSMCPTAIPVRIIRHIGSIHACTQHTAHSKTYSVIAHSKTYSDKHRSCRTVTLSVGHRCTRDAALLVPHRPCCNMLHGSTPLHRETALDPDPSRLWGAEAADGSANKSTATVAKNTHYYRITTHT